MRSLVASLVLLALIASVGIASQSDGPQAVTSQPANLVGHWRVKFEFPALGAKNLIFDAQPHGNGSFLLLDTGPDNKPAILPQPAAWLETAANQISFSAEVELPIGTCCREIGTLVFKGKQTSNDAISGKIIFIGVTEDQENFNGFRSMTGSFSATRAPNK